MVNVALIAGTCIGVFIGVLLSVLLVIIALWYFGICKWPEDSESDSGHDHERDTRNAREYKGIPLHSCVPRLSAEELEMRNKAIAKYKRRKAREERREARQRRREERQARTALLIALAKEKLDNEMMQNNRNRYTLTESNNNNNNEIVVDKPNVLPDNTDTLTSKLNVVENETGKDSANNTNRPTMSREELEALAIEQTHRLPSVNAAEDSNTIHNVHINNQNDSIVCLDRRPSFSSSISASTLTTSVSTSVLTSSAVAYGRGAYLPHSQSYENSVLTVNTATTNNKNNNNKDEDENGNDDEEEEYWPRGMGSASNVQEEDLHHIDIPYYYEESELEYYNNNNDDDNIELQSRRSSASRGTLATIKSYVKQLGSRVRARQRRKARRQWQSENDRDLNSENVDIFNQWETSLSSSSSSESSSTEETESELETNESMFVHNVNANKLERLINEEHNAANDIHDTVNNKDNTTRSTPTLTTNSELFKNDENKQTEKETEAKEKKRRNTKANREQRHRHRHRHHKKHHNNRNIANENNYHNDSDDTHSVASSAPRPPDEILKNYPFLCINNNNNNNNNNVMHSTNDEKNEERTNNNIAKDNTSNTNKSNETNILFECQDNSTKHLIHANKTQTTELIQTHQVNDKNASTDLHKQTTGELQKQHHRIGETDTQEKQALLLSVQNQNNNYSNTLRTPPEHEPTYNTTEQTSSKSSSSESELELTPEKSHKETLHKSHKVKQRHQHHRDHEEKERNQSQIHHSTTVKDYQKKKWTGRDVEHNVAMSGFFTTPLQQWDMMHYPNSYNINTNIGNNNSNNSNTLTASNLRTETSKNMCGDNTKNDEANINTHSSSIIVNNNFNGHNETHNSRGVESDTDSSDIDDVKNKANAHVSQK